ncbi:DNase I-like protein [Coprinopsis marcescibilis]|uniref:DNase I-like protein n=1 Tax=Coprinopsis marcescibilis TaxID=230819 RepID=A0A5C3L780_COPMA|nr:DNase I-like protein [Coprinopsis marcescibilis]
MTVVENERSEIETEASPAVKNLRSRFEQLAVSGGSKPVSRESTGSSLSTNSSVDQAISSSPSTSETLSDLKATALLKRPPPPPPPSRNSARTLQPKRSISPMPLMTTSPLLRPVPTPPGILVNGNGNGLGIMIGNRESQPASKSNILDKPPVPPRPSHIINAIQLLTPEPSPPHSEDEKEATVIVTEGVDHERPSSRLAFPPPPRHRGPLSPNLGPIDGLPSTSTPPPPPLPSRRPFLDTSLQRSPPPSRTNSTLRPISPPPSRTTSTLRPVPPPSPSLSPMMLEINLTGNSPDLGVTSPTERRAVGSGKLPPPPTRTIAPGAKVPARRPSTPESSDEEDEDEGSHKLEQLPDSSNSSRRPPTLSFRPGHPEPRIHYHPHTGVVLASGPNIIVAHEKTLKVYNLELAEPLVHNVEMKEFGLKDTKISSMEFRPSINKANRGFVLWLGTKEGSILEFDIRKGSVTAMKPAAHLHTVTHIFRYGRSMVTLDESGKALVFSPDPENPDIDVNLQQTQAKVVRTTDRQDFVKILDGKLWTSSKAENAVGGNKALPVVRVYDIFNSRGPGKSLLPCDYVGRLTSATIVPTHPDTVYVGHEEGFVSVWNLETEDGWPKCEEVIKVSSSDIMSLVGVNDKLWAGGRGGTISSYLVGSTPWQVTNNWVAHPGLPVLKMFVNHYAIDLNQRLCVVSLGRDETVKVWDGLLGLDWVDNELMKNENSFSTFQDLTALTVTYNCDAARPENFLTGDIRNQEFFNDVLRSVDNPPDLLSFSFQEVIDLENRAMMTKAVLNSGKKGDPLSDKVTGAYRRWHDRLVAAVKTAYGPMGLEYDVLHTESMVGLFTCIFIKRAEGIVLREVAGASVKRGMGGKHGNKGAIISRFVIGDSSVCIVNCHIAAGQHAVRRRNTDITTIMESKSLFPSSDTEHTYVGGGTGAMILDHEFVIWNGDMNYRLELRREAALSAIRSGDLSLLKAHDQLLREFKTNRAFRLRGFYEGPINFLPTYKYDPRSNEYDSSEKRRVPSWCDRVLWRSRVPNRMQQLHYQRYECNLSDHRPVSAAFTITIKHTQPEARARSKAIVEAAWVDEQKRLLTITRDFYVRQAFL